CMHSALVIYDTGEFLFAKGKQSVEGSDLLPTSEQSDKEALNNIGPTPEPVGSEREDPAGLSGNEDDRLGGGEATRIARTGKCEGLDGTQEIQPPDSPSEVMIQPHADKLDLSPSTE